MKNKQFVDDWEKLSMSEETKNRIFKKIKQKTNESTQKTKRNLGVILRKPAVVIAMMICFTMIVSAVTIIYNRVYIPFVGFVEEAGYEIYCTPETVKLGNAVVETVVRAKKDGVNTLSVIITGMDDKNLKVVTENYGEFIAVIKKDYYHQNNRYDLGFSIENFPEINEFTLINNGKSIDIKLEKSKLENMYVVENGEIKINLYQLSSKSKLFAVGIEENYFDTQYMFGIGQLIPEKYVNDAGITGYNFPEDIECINKSLYLDNITMYDENGKEQKVGWGGEVVFAGFDSMMFFGKEMPDNISKMTINSIHGQFDFYHTNGIYSDVDLPVPADNDEIVFDGGLVIYDHNGLTAVIDSISRKGNEITITGPGAVYIGYGNEKMAYTNINWYCEGGKPKGGGYNFETGISQSCMQLPESAETIKLKIAVIDYKINGNWEIDFN